MQFRLDAASVEFTYIGQTSGPCEDGSSEEHLTNNSHNHYINLPDTILKNFFQEGMLDVGIRNRSSVEIERIFPVDEKLTYDDLMSGVVMEPRNSSQRRTREHFRRFCQELYKGRLGTLTLEDLLRFFTGAPYFASMVGAQVKFAEPDEQSSLPVAHACASELILPTVHKSYGHFRTAMVKALEYSGTGFGLV